ncbi:unnamed protein product [Bursaphelenchus xylophilus]|nr:unnamed protein product [Bursaphelenchus xylophilus]CAG9123728.1 unnamed protein product [Bursaphelenchus xylophilus]
MWPVCAVLVLALHRPASALYCFEGTNCELSACGECEGIACVRVLRPTKQSSPNSFFGSMKIFMSPKSSDDFSSDNVAFTCLPMGTRMYDLEPEGCRVDNMNQRMACICYNADYCNNSRANLAGMGLWLICIIIHNAMPL